ncbi:MAG: hypothetical protein WC341_17025 [Bacteroidales bacterium]|jgi:hypothetical protein
MKLKISVEKIQKTLDKYCQESKKDDNELHRYCWVTGQSEDDIIERETPKKHLKINKRNTTTKSRHLKVKKK